DVGHRHGTERGEGISPQRVEKLLPVFGILPFAFVLIEIALRRLGEGDRRRLLGRVRGTLRLTVVDRINAVDEKQSGGAGALARLFQRDSVRWSNSIPALAAVAFIA